jgi:hypothetical protein
MKAPEIRMLDVRDPRGFTYAELDLDLLVPDSSNPRIPAQESVLETLLALVHDDPNGLFNLAKDIVKMRGTNPAELFNVTKVGNTYLVKEGNRRLAVRKILRNPEQLRGQVTDAELERWSRIAKSEGAQKLSTTALVAIGVDHEAWVDRRHLGPQNGVGTAQWKPQAKARRAERQRGGRDRTLSLLDGLKANHPQRFGALQPPERTFTTLERVLESTEARAHIGIDVDDQGNVMLLHGDRSLRVIEHILKDLRKGGSEKLTSRRIGNTQAILDYLDEVDSRVRPSASETPITLSAGDPAEGKPSGGRKKARRTPDLLRSFTPPTSSRPRKLFDELAVARRRNLPNAAIVLTRVLLELCIEQYASDKDLPFAGDTDGLLEQEVKTFNETLGRAKVTPTKRIREVLAAAPSRGVKLSDKLTLVIQSLVQLKAFNPKEAAAKLREINARDVIHLLNDAIHRLETVPSMTRVDHILEVVRPVFNAMHG